MPVIMKTRALRLIWLVSVICVIIGSILPRHSDIVQWIDQSHINDKVQHFSAYAVLAGIPRLERFRCRRPIVVLGFVFALGVALEFAQLFSPGRSCDWRDVVA